MLKLVRRKENLTECENILEINALPLPFSDFSFDLALGGHYLFTNPDLDFHIRLIKELARVAREVRIFPLIDNTHQVSEYLGPILLVLQQENYGAELSETPEQFQDQGNTMLRVWAQECLL